MGKVKTYNSEWPNDFSITEIKQDLEIEIEHWMKSKRLFGEI